MSDVSENRTMAVGSLEIVYFYRKEPDGVYQYWRLGDEKPYAWNKRLTMFKDIPYVELQPNQETKEE